MFGVWPSLKRVGSLTCWNRKQSLIPSRNTDDMCSWFSELSHKDQLISFKVRKGAKIRN